MSELKVPKNRWGHHPNAGKLIEGLQAQSRKMDVKKPSWLDKQKNKVRKFTVNLIDKIIEMVKASVKKWLSRTANKNDIYVKLAKQAKAAEGEAKAIIEDASATSIEVVTAINKHLKSTALAGFAGIDSDLDEMIKVLTP